MVRLFLKNQPQHRQQTWSRLLAAETAFCAMVWRWRDCLSLLQATSWGFSAHSLCFSSPIAEWDAVAWANVCPQNNVAARKMKNSGAQALELDSKATAALATHSHKEGDSLLSKPFYSSVRNAKKHRYKVLPLSLLLGLSRLSQQCFLCLPWRKQIIRIRKWVMITWHHWV